MFFLLSPFFSPLEAEEDGKDGDDDDDSGNTYYFPRNGSRKEKKGKKKVWDRPSRCTYSLEAYACRREEGIGRGREKGLARDMTNFAPSFLPSHYYTALKGFPGKMGEENIIPRDTHH